VRLAGKHADAVFTNGGPITEAQVFYKQVKQSAIAQGRRASDVGIYPGIGPIVGATAEEAERKYQAIRSLVTIDEALLYLGRFFDHHDFSVYPLDAPFPELGDIGRNSFRATTDRIKKTARDNNLTLRETALDVATPRTDFIGTADHIADEIIRWVDEGAADGFILGFPIVAEGFDDFAKYILPILEERGYFDPVLKGETLREHLGLPYRESRYAKPLEDIERGKAVGA
jgi:alkanesulfonate monooxygenase SsuD/methylene tetrahydromethanopterin reductase-like flavin-dependent oxidoreductase (luciferase family)